MDYSTDSKNTFTIDSNLSNLRNVSQFSSGGFSVNNQSRLSGVLDLQYPPPPPSQQQQQQQQQQRRPQPSSLSSSSSSNFDTNPSSQQSPQCSIFCILPLWNRPFLFLFFFFIFLLFFFLWLITNGRIQHLQYY